MNKNKSKIEVCGVTAIHHDTVKKVKEQMEKEEYLYDLADLFKVFGDSTRIKILFALSKSRMCVCDLAAALDMSQSAVSHQLRALKEADLVKFQREGKVVYYSFADEHVDKIFEMGIEHIKE